MEKKYISENRYKKSTVKKRRDISAIRKGKVASNKVKVTSAKKKVAKPKIKPSVRRERRITRRNIFTCIILLVLIAVILRALLKEEGEPFIPIFFGVEENEQVITVGVITDASLLDNNINNVILKELGYYSNYMLLCINEDYSLKYDVIKSVNKTSDKEYAITINESKNYDVNSITNMLESYINDKSSVYYSGLKDIQDVSVINDETLKITLSSSNPYFIYNLDIPVVQTDKKQYEITANSTSTSVEFVRTRYASEEAPAKIVIKRYKDMYEGVEAYKKGTINMLVTNQKNVQNMLGKYEYNLKTYRTGETIFLLLNSNSEWLKNEEIRKVIAYSIDRDSIVKDIMQSAANVIDLPYIYDSVRYKYDIYAAENLLLSNGYKKQNKVYTKNDIQVSLQLLVNKEDTEKLEIATAVKNNLASVGIKVTVEKLSAADIEKRIKKGTYDLVLSSVNLNNKPDIRFLENSIYITDEVKNAINNISETTNADISQEINNLSVAMSNSISYIGLVAKTSYVVYAKDIVGLTDISYLNVFSSLVND